MHWREEHLLEVIGSDKLSTSKIVARADMSKATALKYLAALSGKKLISCEMVGPTKLWSITSDVEEDAAAALSQENVKDFISVERELFRLLEEFEGVTGKGLVVSINKDGLSINRDATATAASKIIDAPKSASEIERNNSMIYTEGYVAGYNQARVDEGLITQAEADAILQKTNCYADGVMGKIQDEADV